MLSLCRIATRGVLPKCILKVAKIILCTACVFASAHCRSWKTKAKQTMDIRRNADIVPGDGTLCAPVISHHPGLVPLQCGTLTHIIFGISHAH